MAIWDSEEKLLTTMSYKVLKAQPTTLNKAKSLLPELNRLLAVPPLINLLVKKMVEMGLSQETKICKF